MYYTAKSTFHRPCLRLTLLMMSFGLACFAAAGSQQCPAMPRATRDRAFRAVNNTNRRKARIERGCTSSDSPSQLTTILLRFLHRSTSAPGASCTSDVKPTFSFLLLRCFYFYFSPSFFEGGGGRGVFISLMTCCKPY